MQRKFLAVICLTFGLAVVPGVTANAQTGAGKSPIRIKFGGFVPGTSATRQAIKSLYLGGGLTYDLAKTAPDGPVLSAFLDVNGDSNGDTELAAQIFTIGVGPEYRFYVNGGPLRFYMGSGIGIYFINAQSGTLRNFRLFTKKDDFQKIGAKLLGGIELRNGFFGELSYTSLTSTNDLNAGGLSANIGFRL
ncbi:MAG: hypothetical protein SFU56_09350 [Capsulimonadales bacterium]|nr:hypothetical protein [Capsulimonadales bacterium]